jgi:hypothetical protein
VPNKEARPAKARHDALPAGMWLMMANWRYRYPSAGNDVTASCHTMAHIRRHCVHDLKALLAVYCRDGALRRWAAAGCRELGCSLLYQANTVRCPSSLLLLYFNREALFFYYVSARFESLPGRRFQVFAFFLSSSSRIWPWQFRTKTYNSLCSNHTTSRRCKT